MPRSIFSIGPPKHAARPINGANLATAKFATRSAIELPMANTVSPTIASERPKMKPNVCGGMDQ